MDTRTRGAVEADLASAVVKFHREQYGRGPSDIRAALLGDLAIVRCIGVLTPTEVRLASTESGRRLVRSSRQELRSIVHRDVEGIVGAIAGCAVLRSYCDVDVEAGEQLEVYVLERSLEFPLGRTPRGALRPDSGGS